MRLKRHVLGAAIVAVASLALAGCVSSSAPASSNCPPVFLPKFSAETDLKYATVSVEEFPDVLNSRLLRDACLFRDNEGREPVTSWTAVIRGDDSVLDEVRSSLAAQGAEIVTVSDEPGIWDMVDAWVTPGWNGVLSLSGNPASSQGEGSAFAEFSGPIVLLAIFPH